MIGTSQLVELLQKEVDMLIGIGTTRAWIARPAIWTMVTLLGPMVAGLLTWTTWAAANGERVALEAKPTEAMGEVLRMGNCHHWLLQWKFLG